MLGAECRIRRLRIMDAAGCGGRPGRGARSMLRFRPGPRGAAPRFGDRGDLDLRQRQEAGNLPQARRPRGVDLAAWQVGRYALQGETYEAVNESRVLPGIDFLQLSAM